MFFQPGADPPHHIVLFLGGAGGHFLHNLPQISGAEVDDILNIARHKNIHHFQADILFPHLSALADHRQNLNVLQH
ncbi:hypothetical protein SDC9_164942 [bioreactor metagenome]|uniref:Uncharacterized protein n=1 Tax=bioreactor metagenome TaxID=1076179 RepID=A0A645FT01_9ZZZZ